MAVIRPRMLGMVVAAKISAVGIQSYSILPPWQRRIAGSRKDTAIADILVAAVITIAFVVANSVRLYCVAAIYRGSIRHAKGSRLGLRFRFE